MVKGWGKSHQADGNVGIRVAAASFETSPLCFRVRDTIRGPSKGTEIRKREWPGNDSRAYRRIETVAPACVRRTPPRSLPNTY